MKRFVFFLLLIFLMGSESFAIDYSLKGFSSTRRYSLEEDEIKHIRGIECACRGVVFDHDLSKAQFTRYVFKNSNGQSSASHGLLTRRDQIEGFMKVLDSLEFVGWDMGNPYCDYTYILNIPRIQPSYQIERHISDDIDGYAVIYYDDGKLPEVIWLGRKVVRNGTVYNFTSEARDSIINYAENSQMPVDSIRQYICTWNAMPVDCTDIIGIRVSYLSQPDAVPVSRGEFAISANEEDRLSVSFKQPVETTRIEVARRSEISQWMNALRKLEFKHTMFFNANETGMTGCLDNDGMFVWGDSTPKVDGWLLIYRSGADQPEIVWFNSEEIDRAYFSYFRSEEFDKLLLEVKNQ